MTWGGLTLTHCAIQSARDVYCVCFYKVEHKLLYPAGESDPLHSNEMVHPEEQELEIRSQLRKLKFLI